jgi:response regulator RpfG family c-di-GMP phosphodiesterase
MTEVKLKMVFHAVKPDFTPTQSGGTKAKVVLLEDQISMRKALRRVIEATDAYTVEEFSSSAQAIHFMASNPVDLVVSDIYLAKGSGFDVLHYLRNRPVGNDVPFLLRVKAPKTILFWRSS